MNDVASPPTPGAEGTHLIDEIIHLSDFTFERLPMLDIIGARLVENLSMAFPDLTGAACDTELLSLDYVPLEQIMEGLPNPVFLAVGTGKPFDGEVLLAMDHKLLLTSVELMLGGTANEVSEEAPNGFTAIELGFGERLAASILAELQLALSVVGSASLELDRVDSDPDGAAIAKATSLCARLKLSLAMAGHVGALDVIIPYDALETIRPDLSKIYFGDRGEDQSTWQELISGQIERAQMELEVVLTEEAISLKKLTTWQPGDVIDFGIEDGEVATMVCADTPMFKVTLGHKNNGFVAAQITEEIEIEEEQEDVGSNN